MPTDVDRTFAEAAGRLDRRDLLARRVQVLEATVLQVIQQLEALDAENRASAIEAADLQDLDAASLLQLVLGSDQPPSSERQRAVAARLRHVETKARLEALSFALTLAREELGSLTDAQQEFERALARQEAELLAAGGPTADAVRRLVDEERRLGGRIEQVVQTLNGVARCREALDRLGPRSSPEERVGVAVALGELERDLAEVAPEWARTTEPFDLRTLEAVGREAARVMDIADHLGDRLVEARERLATIHRQRERIAGRSSG